MVVFLLASPARAQTETASTAPAAQKLPAPATAVDSKTCTNAGCHPEVKQYKSVHGPVNVDACDACHKLTDASKHKYELTRSKQELCTFCHKLDLGDNPVVHQPVKTGDCLPCHNPHGGPTEKILRGTNMRELCASCHKDAAKDKKFVHGPVAAGACDACHQPHASKNAKLLIATGRDLCTTCHKEMADQLAKAKVTHKPVVQGQCTDCHDPHASDFAMQAKAAPAELCTSCHEHDKIKNAAMHATDKHSVVTTGQACLTCHTAHGGSLSKLLKAEPDEICLKCHKDDQKDAAGKTVHSVAVIADASLSRHGPAKDGQCSGCHEVHGSNVTRLLAKPYPESFYTKYDPDNFALCFTCHDKALIETKDAQGLTGFRNGTQNLHYLHVDRDKGRTCRACHETHAAPNPLLIRASVPFGQWELPINFKKTEAGGSCSPGCHKPYSYDRDTPVDNGTGHVPPAPATSPTSAPAAKE